MKFNLLNYSLYTTMYLSMIIILTDFHLLLAESILRTRELLKCYFYQFEECSPSYISVLKLLSFINMRNALLEGDISIEITSVTVGICIRCIYKQLAIPPTIPIYTFGRYFALYYYVLQLKICFIFNCYVFN